MAILPPMDNSVAIVIRRVVRRGAWRGRRVVCWLRIRAARERKQRAGDAELSFREYRTTVPTRASAMVEVSRWAWRAACGWILFLTFFFAHGAFN